MYISICDSSTLDAKTTEELLNRYFSDKSVEYTINKYYNGTDLIYDIQDGIGYDLIFLGIYIGNELGIDIAKYLREIGFNGEIVFITITSEFAIAGYDVDATGYLLKPHNYDKLCKVMDKVLKNYDINFYRIRQRNSLIRINYDDIFFVESNNSKCIVHSSNDKDYTIYKKLDEIEKELKDKRFLRCHQSYLVNMNYITKAEKNFKLANGSIISIRQRNLKQIKDKYYNYIDSKLTKKV